VPGFEKVSTGGSWNVRKGFLSWRNLVEKGTGKKKDLTPILSLLGEEKR
jgi:hypothetical protein